MTIKTINLINRLNDKIRRFILHVDNRARGECSFKIDGDNVYIKTGNMRFLICASVSDLLSKNWNEVKYTRVEYESEAGIRIMSDYFDLFGYLKEEIKSICSVFCVKKQNDSFTSECDRHVTVYTKKSSYDPYLDPVRYYYPGVQQTWEDWDCDE